MSKRIRVERFTPYLFLLPAIILLIIFRYVPMLAGFREAFYTNALSQLGDHAYVGMDNFNAVLSDQRIIRAFGTTLAFSLVVNPLQVTLALLLAELLNQRVRGIAFFRAICLIPVAISINVTAIAWGLALDPNYGLVNGILRSLGLPSQPFLGSAAQAMWVVILIISWVGVPYWSLFFLAGLQDITKEVLESASMDGATNLQIFLRIKVPLLRRTLSFVLVSDTVINFTLFAPVYLLTRGGPQQSTNLIMYEAWRRGFVYGDLGVAAAMISVLLIFVLIFVLLEFVVFRPQH